MRRPRRTGEETREAILATAERLFRERGFAAVSIADIAAELDMSPANVFKHFKSKLTLGRAIAYRHGRRLAGRCGIEDSSAPPDQKLTLFLSRLAREHVYDKLENQYLFEMIPLVLEDPAKGGRIYRRLVEDKLSALIGEAMESGIYRPGDPERDAGVVVDMLASVLHPKMMHCADPATLSAKTALIIELIDGGLKYRVAK
ncbi:TetR/AcrR family transcriptional regulator [Martelella soudanensis]|uniref:TetR/AcrR family transcriptional regulator n=1 Tax=unclassified Martelella TaxID=2629616 RepID=UPI0015DF0D65|nr:MULTISPECIES: TetR/AcrR family transcriptional regulator [unclassified Martelella]